MSATSETWRDGLRSPSRRSKVLLLAAAGLGVIHEVDHVLRADHSGWPFLDEVTPFTFFAVAVLPVILFAYFAHFDRSRPWLSFGLVAFLLVAVLFAHVFLETPGDQYGAWAINASTESYALGRPNLLNVESPILGVLAAVEAALLDLSLLAAAVSLFVDARRAGVRA